MRITISKENYLKAIAEAASEGEIVKPVTLARWLQVSAPAVTMALRRLRRDRLIREGDEGRITLTPAGRAIANRLLHRHHLVERMLTEIFGLEWYKVHDEAERLEHAVSADFERQLVAKLGRGSACPHGNRVGMDSPRERRRRGLKPLEEASPHEPLVVASVFERDRALLEYLDRSGLTPGAQFEIVATEPHLILLTGERRRRLDRGVASKIWVRAAGPTTKS